LLRQGIAMSQASASPLEAHSFVESIHGVRYQVKDVARAVALDGQGQEPGGWNRVVLTAADLPGCMAALENVGVRFQNPMETGPGGRQVQIEDPDGNPMELFEPAR
jgi:glyoxylase I family protein